MEYGALQHHEIRARPGALGGSLHSADGRSIRNLTQHRWSDGHNDIPLDELVQRAKPEYGITPLEGLLQDQKKGTDPEMISHITS